jgi:menaquinone-dependent protoporphyrinogen IX oxidase
MKIGIIFYSHTGHTALIAKKLVVSMENSGHKVDSIQLETIEPLQLSAMHAAIKNVPNVDNFDMLFIGTPVHGGRIAAPVLTFLESVLSFSGKKVSFFLTHFFPRKWGAIQTIQALEVFCASKGAMVQSSADVTWFSIFRKRQIKRAVSNLSQLN